MDPSALRRQVIDLLWHPLLVGSDGVPPGATEAELQEVEKHFEVPLPPALRDWYTVVNGAFCGTQRFVATYNHDPGPDFETKPWLPVAEDGCGDFYFVDLAGPEPYGGYSVFFWDHESDFDVKACEPTKGYAVASDVWIFSLQLLSDELRRTSASEDQRELWDQLADGGAADGASAGRQEPWHWPFDRERTLNDDPNLANVTSARLPWKIE